ncbi:3-oxoacyl-[acyl-carrier-protein] reductase [Geminicoccus flavidas]|uniref:3-oxoacyl-[acyl-carrier-protein] reductase n=1 Tax=Geminicoccus flavidas TaxID=2506407 RepID=UPI001357BB2C|nr:3-oxoacyl-[acyl-carrier-protein] reductase [Geminicoccus flavidas]
MFDLSARRALVTGATGGIGEAIARALHARGASLVITGRREEVLAKLAAELGDRVQVVVADLAEPDAAERLMKEAEAAGPVDVLVNNAGITRDMLAMRMKDEDWSAVIETNLSAVFRLSRAGLKGMMKRRHGRIINIGSVVGATGNAGQANYAAAKAGLVGMTKALAAELGSRGITVNCVAPGFIDTAMTQKLDEKQRDSLLGRIPAGRLGAGADIAAAVVYLASDEAAYVTGQTLHVNGGMAMI